MKKQIVLECQRLSENCLYLSTSLFMWLREKRTIKNIFIIVPIVLGSIAGFRLLTEQNEHTFKWITGLCSLIAGLMPAVYSALKLDDHLELCKNSASQFKNLQDRFRQTALISSKKPVGEFEAEFQKWLEKYENLKSESLTPPERLFKKAQSKINSGDYTFSVDISEED